MGGRGGGVQQCVLEGYSETFLSSGSIVGEFICDTLGDVPMMKCLDAILGTTSVVKQCTSHLSFLP